MTTREENRIRIVREIPLWGVITGLIAVLMMAGAELEAARDGRAVCAVVAMPLYLLTPPTAEPV